MIGAVTERTTCVCTEDFVGELKRVMEVLEREPTVNFVWGFFHYIKHRRWLDRRRNREYEKYMLVVKSVDSVKKFLHTIGVRHSKHLRNYSNT